MNAPLWYFAYGANMAQAKLAQRGIAPTASLAARLDGWVLRFNHRGEPPLEPVFASIEPWPGGTVYGVVYAITPAEAAELDRLEYGYDRVQVTLALRDGTACAGFAYQSAQPCPEGVPSARYLRLLLAGARAYDLPPIVIARFEGLLVYADRDSLSLGARWESKQTLPITHHDPELFTEEK